MMTSQIMALYHLLSHISSSQSLSLSSHSHRGTITKIGSPGTITSRTITSEDRIIASEGRTKEDGKISAKVVATNADSTATSTEIKHPSRKSHSRKCYSNCLKTETSLLKTTKSSISLLQPQSTIFSKPTSSPRISPTASRESTKLPSPHSEARRN